MHVRPRADQHGVEAAGCEQLFPIRIGARNAELVGGAPARLERPVRDGDELDARLPLQARNVHRAHDAARADDADADRLLHGRGSPLLREQCRRRQGGGDGHRCGRQELAALQLEALRPVGLVAHRCSPLTNAVSAANTIPASLVYVAGRRKSSTIEAQREESPMNERRSVAVVAAAAVLVVALAHGQAPAPADSAATKWTPRLTADGQPDLQGTWVNFDSTPFEADQRRRIALRQSREPARALGRPRQPDEPDAPLDGRRSAGWPRARHEMGRGEARLRSRASRGSLRARDAVGALHHARSARRHVPGRLQQRLRDRPDSRAT